MNVTRIERRNYKPEDMMYKRLGRTNFLVSRIALGGYGNPDYPKADDDPPAYKSMLQFLIGNGVNYFDTAPDYGTEGYFGDVLAKRENRRRVFISTKIKSMMKDPVNNIPWSSKDEFEHDIRSQLDNSLRLLRTDHVDMLLLHHLNEVGKTTYLRRGYVGPNWQYFKWAYKIIDELIREGKVTCKGFTSHHPKTAKKAVLLERYTTDVVMANYAITKHMTARTEDWEDTFLACKSKDVGIIQMKALLGPRRDPEQKMEQITSDPAAKARIKPYLDLGYDVYKALLLWSLSNKYVHTSVLGMRRIYMAEENLLIVRSARKKL